MQNNIAGMLPESWLIKRDKQRKLERQGCRLCHGQELLDNHELDHKKECYCGRPNKKD